MVKNSTDRANKTNRFWPPITLKLDQTVSSFGKVRLDWQLMRSQNAKLNIQHSILTPRMFQ